MFTNSKLTKSIRLAMAAGTAAAISSSNVYAQEAANAVAQADRLKTMPRELLAATNALEANTGTHSSTTSPKRVGRMWFCWNATN